MDNKALNSYLSERHPRNQLLDCPRASDGFLDVFLFGFCVPRDLDPQSPIGDLDSGTDKPVRPKLGLHVESPESAGIEVLFDRLPVRENADMRQGCRQVPHPDRHVVLTVGKVHGELERFRVIDAIRRHLIYTQDIANCGLLLAPVLEHMLC